LKGRTAEAMVNGMVRVGLAGVALAMPACMDKNASSGNAPGLDGSRWSLSTLEGKAPLPRTQATLEFEAGRVGGSDGCNHFSGSYTQTGSGLRLGPDLAATLMGCEQDVMTQASAFMDALLRTRSFRISGDRLELRAGDEAPALVLVRNPAAQASRP
jgi:heat shock protein HslJ